MEKSQSPPTMDSCSLNSIHSSLRLLQMDSSNTYLKEMSGDSKDQESGSSCNCFLELPEDVIANILRRLGAYEILKNAQRMCSSWRNICKDPSMWRFIDMKHLGCYGYYDDVRNQHLEAMCRQAVDWSQGQLTELHIDHFATDELLRYISERSCKLRSLQIRGCDEVSHGFIEVAKSFLLLEELHFVIKLSGLQIRSWDEVSHGFIEAAKKFPLLEELHFVYVLGVRDYIETIGQSCPNLKSFTFSSSDYIDSRLHEYDESKGNFEALAIAKTMPGLRHLRLVGIDMTNKGLEAVLDGCPNLESLDIRRCFNVDLHGGIGDRIAQKIKDFKCPNDPVEGGSDWDADPFYKEDYSDDFDETPYMDYAPDDDYSFCDSIYDFDYPEY